MVTTPVVPATEDSPKVLATTSVETTVKKIVGKHREVTTKSTTKILQDDDENDQNNLTVAKDARQSTRYKQRDSPNLSHLHLSQLLSNSDPEQAQYGQDRQKNLALICPRMQKAKTGRRLQRIKGKEVAVGGSTLTVKWQRFKKVPMHDSGSLDEACGKFAKKEHPMYFEKNVTKYVEIPRFESSTARQEHAIRVTHKTNVSRPQPRSNQMKEKVVPYTSHAKLKKTEVEEQPRISSISNKTKSVTARNDNLNSRTSNANAVCATCGK
ncbi:hypothetical protein Tco_0808396, partial [Tanacetum coccineum]